MDRVELICIAVAVGVIVVVILVAVFWRPFAAVRHSDENHESGLRNYDPSIDP